MLKEIQAPKKLTATSERAALPVWYLQDENGFKRCITDEQTATFIETQFTRLNALEGFVQKFLDNLKDCPRCNGSGWNEELEDPCDHCHGEGKVPASYGVLYVELPDEARTLLGVQR